MADYNSSLPVRTENPGDVIVKISDATIPSQQLLVNPDGSINTNVTATDLDIRDLVFATDKVDVSGSEVSLDAGTLAALENISAVVTATDLDIRDLAFATDSVDVSGSEVSLDAGTLAALENINAVVTATDLDIRDLVFATDKVDVTGSEVSLDSATLAALETITVVATDLDIRDLDAATDSVSAWLKDEAGNAFSASNPLHVVAVESEGDEINDYKTAAALAGGATDNHDYTVTALKTLMLTQIEASGSGKIKITVQVETGVGAGTYNTRFVQFNSTAAPNCTLVLKEPIAVAAGVKVRVAVQNRDNQAQDVYSTICGHEV